MNPLTDDFCLATAVTNTVVSPIDTVAVASAKRAYLPVPILSVRLWNGNSAVVVHHGNRDVIFVIYEFETSTSHATPLSATHPFRNCTSTSAGLLLLSEQYRRYL